MIYIIEGEVVHESSSPALLSLGQIFLPASSQAGHTFSPQSNGVTKELASVLTRYGFQNVQMRPCVLEYRFGTPAWQAYYDDVSRAARIFLPFLSKWATVPPNYDELCPAGVQRDVSTGLCGDLEPAHGLGDNATQVNGERKLQMIKPYTAVGLIPTVRGIRTRADIKRNLEHLSHLVKAASWLSSLDLPVRLIAFPEGALQGFNDEVLDLDHVQFARECAIDIPGEETEALGKIARQYDAFIMAQAKARHPEIPDRFFNVGFILNPRAKSFCTITRYPRFFPVEHSVCPHDVLDWWIERYGRTLDAFWPVVDTEIGRLGIMMANEGHIRKTRASGPQRRRSGLSRLLSAPGHRQRYV